MAIGVPVAIGVEGTAVTVLSDGGEMVAVDGGADGVAVRSAGGDAVAVGVPIVIRVGGTATAVPSAAGVAVVDGVAVAVGA